MKILLCVDRLTGGGAQRVASLWATGWAQLGHDINICLSNDRTPRTYSVPDSAKFYSIDWNITNGYVRHLMKLLFSKRRMIKVIKQVDPDVIITVGTHWSEIVYEARERTNLLIPIICTDHNSYERPLSAPMSKRDTYLKYEFSKRFEQVTVLTQADKDFIGGRLTNVDVLPNPLAFEPVQSLPQKKKTIIAVGRLDAGHSKGFDILIKAFGMSRHSGWILQIAGGGSKDSLEKYKNLAERCGVKNDVEFLGFVDDPISLYRESSIFILSSRYEGFGMVLIEAMSQGCACIACDYKGRQKEIITNENEGMICPTEDVDALSECIERLIRDTNYRELIQSNAPKRASFYSLDNIMERWNVIFKKLKLI